VRTTTWRVLSLLQGQTAEGEHLHDRGDAEHLTLGDVHEENRATMASGELQLKPTARPENERGNHANVMERGEHQL